LTESVAHNVGEGFKFGTPVLRGVSDTAAASSQTASNSTDSVVKELANELPSIAKTVAVVGIAYSLYRAYQAGWFDKLSRKRTKVFPHLGDRAVVLTAEEEQFLECVVLPESIPTTMDDVGGLGDVKQGVQESVILPFTRPDLFRTSAKHGGLINGVLLYGPPGTGKTLIARAIAKECGACFINVDAAAIKSHYYGDSESNVAALFSLARKLQPSIIFIDEIDSLLSKRTSDSAVSDVDNSVKAGIMTQWDGLTKSKDIHVIVIGATNRAAALDQAVMRRLSRRFSVPLPDKVARKQILDILLSADDDADSEYHHNVDTAVVAQLTKGFSGSDLKSLCNVASLLPVRELLAAESLFTKNMGNENERPVRRALNTNDMVSTIKEILSGKDRSQLVDFV